MQLGERALTAVKVVENLASPAAAAGIAWVWPLQAVGFTPAALFMAAVGTAIGIFLDPPGGTRVRLFGLAVCYTLLAAACAIAIGHFPGMDFFNAIAPLTALIFAAFAQTLTPIVRAALAKRAASTIGGKDP